MPKSLIRKIYLSLTVFFVLFQPFLAKVFAEDSLGWYKTPVISNLDLKNVFFFSPESGIAYAKQILVFKNNRWFIYPFQPPKSVDNAFAIDSCTFFVSSKTKYHESELYFGKGQHWKKINHPLANAISAMYFTDSVNGVIAGVGEIAVLKNNQWRWLPPPTNKIINTVVLGKDSIIWALARKVGIFKYDGKWTKIKHTEKISSLQYSADKAYVISDSILGFVDHNDSLITLSTHPGLKNIISFFVINQNEIMAAGLKGLIMQYKNGHWKYLESEVNENLNAIWMINNHDGWIAGDGGLMLHYTSSENAQTILQNWRGFEVSYLINATAKIIDDEYGVVAADFNKDGLTDIFTCGLFEENHLYINLRNNQFFDQAQQRKISGTNSTGVHELNLGACSGDFDNDGNPDLYLSVLNGSNKLYRNIGGKYFIDYSQISGGTGNDNDRTNSVISGDVDNDGDLDIFIANENSTNRLFLNNGAAVFTEATQSSGLGTGFGGTGCSFGDIDNDGDIDLYVANWSTKNILYRNLLIEEGKLFFKDITEQEGVGGEVWTKSNGVVFSDIDNDADLDLFVTNRKTSNKLYLNDGNGLFTDKTADLIGVDSLKSYGAVITDFDGDGFKDIYVNNIGKNTFYKNINGKRFADKTSKYGVEIGGYSTGSAVADFDNNGSPDIYIANFFGESSAMLMNRTNNQNFVKVMVRGIKNNRSGIGAKVYFYTSDSTAKLINYAEISGGSGYASMNQQFLPTAIQDQNFVDIKVVFPMGEIKTIKHVKAGSSIIVEDETGIKKTLLLTSRYLLLNVKDSDRLLLLLAWLFILIIIAIALAYGLKKYEWTFYFSISFIGFLLFVFYFQTGYFAYRNLWLSIILPILSIIILIMLNLFYFERSRIKKAAAVHMEQTQKKLSRDLHDDLGSTVSTIGIYLTLIRYNLKNNEEKLNQLLDKTAEMVNNTASAITDMVWVVNPKPESLDTVVFRIHKNFITLFHERGIQFIVKPKTDTEKILLNYKVKQNIYLIIKEAINNALKYANAQQVEIVIEKRGQEIHISIKDNGTGFDISALKNKGQGMTNMRTRAEEINARFEIKSTQNEGTEIEVFFKPV